jgi:hypothetical protein
LKVISEVLEITDKNVYGKYFKSSNWIFNYIFTEVIKIRLFGGATIYTSLTLSKI